MPSFPDVDIEAAPGLSYFTPAQNPPAGTAADPQTSGKPVPKLFQPFTVRGVRFKNDWVAATKRAVAAGADFIEIHNAHGYLLSSFLSPQANTRTDEYGGSFENRMRLPLEIAQLTRNAVGENVPVFLRVSATDWVEETLPEESWTLNDTVRFAEVLAAQGAVDLIDISSGGVHAAQKVKSGPAFQAPFAIAVKKAVGDKLLVATVGAITNGKQANRLLEEDGLDVALVGRGFQKDPGLAWTFAQHVDTEISMASQIRWGFTRRGGSPYIDPSAYKQSIFE